MKDKIKQLLQHMTLEEKAALCSGADTWHTKQLARLNIPDIMVSDGPHGLRKQEKSSDNLGLYESVRSVCYPAACAGASSFDTELLEKLGDILGKECQHQNISILLGPAVNIKRSPLCGRNFEYFSEDPYLSGKLAAAYIKGVQKHNVGTSCKHFAANNQETSRQTISAQMSERTLREIYLKAFEIAVKEEKPWSIMSSYNRINGIYSSESKKLLTDILRTEWNFDGFVMSDWGAVNDRVNALDAGLDLEMPGSADENDKKIISAIQNGSLSMEKLDHAVLRLLNIVFAANHTYCDDAELDLSSHHKSAVDMAAECAVLLKNDDILPLDSKKKIVYIGYFAEFPRYQGGGSSHINAWHVTSALNAARQAKLQISYCPGFKEKDEDFSEKSLADALAAAADADYAVIFAGLPDSYESEGYDRNHMRLPEQQNKLIEAVCSVQSNTAVVLHNGSPIEMPWIDKVKGVLEMYLAGEGVGEATHMLLYGEKNPCGKLPETFPVKLEDNPSYLNFPGKNRMVTYAEEIFVGYRYYEKKKMPVLFPFGHGLSYTHFTYKNFRVSDDTLSCNNTIKIYVDVENTGDCFGKEIIQLYMSDKTNCTVRPEKELIGFAKLSLDPGECKTAEFTVDFRSLAWYCEELSDWYAAKGYYELSAASSSTDIKAKTTIFFETAQTLPFKIDRFTTVGELLAEPSTKDAIQTLLKKLAVQLSQTGINSMPPETVRKMAESLPLSAIQGFMKMSDAELENIIHNLFQDQMRGI